MGTPAQSAHEELSPAQTPQASALALPPHTPAQSMPQLFAVLASHVPQLSFRAAPLAAPAQSRHESLPAHTPHLSAFLTPPHTPAQSMLQSFVELASHVPQLSRRDPLRQAKAHKSKRKLSVRHALHAGLKAHARCAFGARGKREGVDHPLATPAQSRHESLPAHTPHLSFVAEVTRQGRLLDC